MDRGKQRRIMKGVILAAGKGTRLNMGSKPLVKVNEKHLIEHALQNMLELGIKNVIIVQNEKDIENILQYSWKGIALDYVTQEDKLGIAHALSLTEELVAGEDMVIILGDVVYKGDLEGMMYAFINQNVDLLVAMKIVKDKDLIKKSYGYVGKMFVEKPQSVTAFRPWLGLGIYMANSAIFRAIERTPVSSLRNEKEITDALNYVEDKDIFLLNDFYTNVNTKEELDSLIDGKTIIN